MTTLYRTPNVIVDRHEWHAAVELRGRRTSLVYRWRPLSDRAERWQPISQWQGRKPKGLSVNFARFAVHIREAMGTETLRAAVLAGLARSGPDVVRRFVGGRRALGLTVAAP